MELLDNLKSRVVCRNIKIVFPEATNPRILGAAARLKSDELVEPILIGDPTDIANAVMARGINIPDFTVINLNDYKKWGEMVEAFAERRNEKATKGDAEKILKDVNYFSTMSTYMSIVDGMASGATHSTGSTVRPALQITKTESGVSRTSGAFLMIRGRDQERYLFSGYVINVNPTIQELTETTVDSAKTAELLDIEPKVSLLGFSTEGSAKASEVTKVAEATKIARGLVPEYAIDSELQFDAPYVSSAAQLKTPSSKVAGEAAVSVFPNLQSGNIGYKIAQRLGNSETIGPILQGSNKPASDLSRSANEEGVYKLSIITAARTLTND